MTTIPHLTTDCQEDISFDTGPREPDPAEPIATPLLDSLIASYQAGMIDAAGADTMGMPLAEWLEAHRDGATAAVEPMAIYFEEVGS